MANFQESRFLGISSRTIWLTIGVAGLVVGLFFIPELIKFKFSSHRQVANKQQQRATAPKAEQSSERASLGPSALKDLSSNLKQKSAAPEVKTSKKPSLSEQPAQDEGLFSGLNLRVKAGVSGSAPSVGIPAGLTVEKLNTKVAQNFFRAGRNELSRFINHSHGVPYGAHNALETLLGGCDAIVNGLPKEANLAEAAQQLQGLHGSALQALASTGADRGLLLEYLRIPVVRFIDESTGGSSAATLLPRFAPRMVLRSANLRQVWNQPGLPPGAQLVGELGVKGSDVQKVVVYAGSVKVGEYAPGRADGEGFGSIRVQGDALQMWTFVAYDKYGGRPFSKSYSFIPRARRFGTRADGTYKIAFRPGSSRYSLDRFFYAGGTRLGSTSGDPSVSVF
jgi:hypothetical protein